VIWISPYTTQIRDSAGRLYGLFGIPDQVRAALFHQNHRHWHTASLASIQGKIAVPGVVHNLRIFPTALAVVSALPCDDGSRPCPCRENTSEIDIGECDFLQRRPGLLASPSHHLPQRSVAGVGMC
jgi:hypothetical protein